MNTSRSANACLRESTDRSQMETETERHGFSGISSRCSNPLAAACVAPLARLIRIEYCLLGAAGVLLGAFLSGGSVFSSPVLLSTAAVFFVAAACYAFDDVSDMECDRLNGRRDRPLVVGQITPRTAIAAGSISLVLATILAVCAGVSSAAVIGMGVAIAMIYNRWLRGVIALKNVLFAAVFPVPLLIGWLAGDGIAGALLIYVMVLVFVAGLGFETMIDVADAEGDRKSSIATFATRYGTLLSAKVAAGFHICASVLIVLLFVLPLDLRLQWNPVFLVLALSAGISNGFIAARLIRSHNTPHVFALKRMAFATLHAGMAAIVLGLVAMAP